MLEKYSQRTKGWIKLALVLFGIWFILWVITPIWVSHSPAQQRLAEVQERYDIPFGALYYNDLPFIMDAFTTVNDTWRYLPRGPKKE